MDESLIKRTDLTDHSKRHSLPASPRDSLREAFQKKLGPRDKLLLGITKVAFFTAGAAGFTAAFAASTAMVVAISIGAGAVAAAAVVNPIGWAALGLAAVGVLVIAGVYLAKKYGMKTELTTGDLVSQGAISFLVGFAAIPYMIYTFPSAVWSSLKHLRKAESHE